MKAQILGSTVSFIEQTFRTPLQLSSGSISEITEARVTVRVRVDGREAEGHGSVYLSDLWAWPGTPPEHGEKEATMRAFCQALSDALSTRCGGEAAHPLELGLRLHHATSHDQNETEMPLLAKAVCASPFDAAIHDAVGRTLNISAFDFYRPDEELPSADPYFPEIGAARAILQLLRPPVSSLPAWWVISAKDDLEEKVRPMIAKNGIRCFKIKVLAKDNEEDAYRTSEIFQAAKRWGLSPVLSLDSNEGNPDAASVADYLDRLEKLDVEAYQALAYLEQPTGRNILTNRQNWREVAKRKPILLDEGLTSLDLLSEAKSQGWSGLALKTCKGHSFTLVAAAWARREGLLLSLQDLTNPGHSAIHSFLLGSHLETLNGIELNSPQYTPAANEDWLPGLSGLFEPRNGVHCMETSRLVGLH